MLQAEPGNSISPCGSAPWQSVQFVPLPMMNWPDSKFSPMKWQLLHSLCSNSPVTSVPRANAFSNSAAFAATSPVSRAQRSARWGEPEAKPVSRHQVLTDTWHNGEPLTVVGNTAPAVGIPVLDLDIEAATLTSPLARELEDLQADLKKAEELVRGDVRIDL